MKILLFSFFVFNGTCLAYEDVSPKISPVNELSGTFSSTLPPKSAYVTASYFDDIGFQTGTYLLRENLRLPASQKIMRQNLEVSSQVNEITGTFP